MPYDLMVNGHAQHVEADADTPLLWVLREKLELTGTKFGCGGGFCRACTVHLDGVAMPSCQVPVGAVGTQKITTIEGLAAAGGAAPGARHAVQQAWIAAQIPQCGYCQSGMIMAVAALLVETPNPTDDQINDKLVNICRCGTYTRVRTAIHALAQAGSGSAAHG